MTFNPQIETLILEASNRKSPHFVANVINFQQFDQEDVKDTAQKLIEDGQIQATLHFHYNDLCTIDFIPQAV
ncbi:hypothetical protein A5821_000725 [Enterococcus sp. 7F3_DIV0205]|uniref:Uncharacterized protein n=1 Tax=Candidatus Enterococcus palustris TaxID=1834189 RepID=A0AAQ3Y6G1_9ENTE|nr:hypothetical protein [Enterococcus sp. 7F3_DIV0205]OTN85140.1 hypothetical protein A5821_001069 [Enterococcus sp. 7F3_DIV0205]